MTNIERIYRLFEKGPYTLAEHVHSLTGSVWASQFLSAVIASERCFCVVSPFHAKKLLKTSTMAAIIVVCSVILIGGMMTVLWFKNTSGCWFDPETNLMEIGTIVSSFYINNRSFLDIVDIYVYGFAFSGTFLIVVLVTTSITVVKLRSALAWRVRATSTTTTTSAMCTTSVTEHADVMMSSKDLSVTLMLVVTSALFVVHVTPNLCLQVSILIVPDLSSTGNYKSLSAIFWYIVTFLWTLNSSLNCVVYYKMSSRYREVVKALLSRLCRN
ncbi:uncharacterized protein LOC112554173 [Pomacea canaliculata]|uniref:uncharacterized protein LOC112554173 n=1 Tax=Pomacea canaliculata TaxID=400727 RepID=UPI000D732CC0|nr:uncharacterized protein LOC112554173 [Pomacea canaliculata]